MNKKEEKAINELKSMRKYFEYQPTGCNWRLSFNEEEVHTIIDVIINLIDKQQKEIEELIKINTPMSWEMKDKDGNVVISLKKPDDYISKDKIREAIKDREIELYADNPEDNFIPFDEVIDTLKELLEEK